MSEQENNPGLYAPIDEIENSTGKPGIEQECNTPPDDRDGFFIEIVESRYKTKSTCYICGIQYKPTILDATLGSGGWSYPPTKYGHICPACLDNGPDRAAQRFINRAELLRKEAANLESLAGEIKKIPAHCWQKSDDVRLKVLNHITGLVASLRDYGSGEDIPF